MTLDEAIERYTSNAEYERTHENLQGCLGFRQLAEWLKDYKRLLEQEPCEDCISRQAVMNCFKKWQPYMATRLFGFEKELSSLPSVTPQPKTGHWQKISADKYSEHVAYYFRCSECGKDIIGEHNYCANCGCRMKRSE